jgi:hypothetical protein
MHLHSTSMAAVDFGTGSCCKNRSTLCQLHPEPPPEEHPPVREVPAISLANNEHPCKTGGLDTDVVAVG